MSELGRIFGYMRPYLGRIVGAAVLLGIAGALMSAVLLTLQPIVDEVFLGNAHPVAAESHDAEKSRFDFLDSVKKAIPKERFFAWAKDRALLAGPLLLAAIVGLQAILLYFGQYLVMKAGTSVIRDLRADLHEAITYQSLRFFQANPTGTILSRILADVARLQKVSTDVFADFVRVGGSMPFTVGAALLIDWKLTLVAMVALPLLAYPMVQLSKRLRKASTRSQERQGDTASLLAETLAGAKVVQGFVMERFEIARFRAALDRMLAADLKAARAVALAPAVMQLFGGIAGGLLFAYAGRQVAKGRISGGEVTTILALLGYLFMSLRRMNTINTEAQQAIAAARRIFDVMDREREIRDLPGAAVLPPFAREIRFEHVDFAYDADKVLDRIDLTIRRGETIALVGLSGSGKTTIANLVPRFYDPTAGRLTIDDHDIRQVTLASLRGQIGLVTQETVLFNDTVQANIAYGRA